MPIFTARTSMSVMRNASWCPRRSGSVAWQSTTPVVFCTVSAVTTPDGRAPSAEAMRTSAIRPAPPDGSRPAQISRSGALVEAGPRYGLTRSLEGRDAGDVLADDERVDVVRALVREHALEVQHVAAALVLVGHAVGAEDVAGVARAVAGHRDAVALGK